MQSQLPDLDKLAADSHQTVALNSTVEKQASRDTGNGTLLPPFPDEDRLRRALSACHDAIYFATAKDPAAAFDILSLIIAAKIYDEQHTFSEYEFRKKDESAGEMEVRFKELLLRARRWLLNGDVDVGQLAPVPFLPEAVIQIVYDELQNFSLTATSDSSTGTDVLGIAYEQLVGSTFRGELGSYFTPRNIADFMVQLMDIKAGKVFDPSCGSAGLLVASLR